jgi:hypothetical protein
MVLGFEFRTNLGYIFVFCIFFIFRPRFKGSNLNFYLRLLLTLGIPRKS